MGYILKFRSSNLYTIIIVAKINKVLLNKKERVKGFFIFMNMLSFQTIWKKKPCERGCSRIIKFSHFLNSVNMVSLFFQFEPKKAVHAALTNKKIYDIFTRRVSFPLKRGKVIFQQSRRLKSLNFPLGVNHCHHTDFSKLVNVCPVK